MRIFSVAAILVAGISLSGCVAYDVASTAVDATTSVVGTAADVTGDVVGGVASTVSGGDSGNAKKD